jgi:hypothetical protein
MALKVDLGVIQDTVVIIHIAKIMAVSEDGLEAGMRMSLEASREDWFIRLAGMVRVITGDLEDSMDGPDLGGQLGVMKGIMEDQAVVGCREMVLEDLEDLAASDEEVIDL